MRAVTRSDHRDATAKPTESELNSFELGPDIDVYSWSPEPPGTANAKCTQVHVYVGSVPKFLMRFKGPDTLDKVIDALIEHREFVFGARP
jgi:hypothetical protein